MTFSKICMTPTEYKDRYVSSQPDLPPDIDIDLTSFITYNEVQLSGFNFDSESIDFFKIGLPEEAAPYLNFNSRLEYLSGSNEFVVIGFNGSGDNLCVSEVSGKVVYFNHDDGMREVLISSSFRQFCEALCLFSESQKEDFKTGFIADLRLLDQPASEPGNMWHDDFLMMSED